MKNSKKVVKKNSLKSVLKPSKKPVSRPVPRHVEIKGFLSFFILHELDRKNLSGDELAGLVGERRGSVLTPGTIYPALKRLRRQKLVQYRRKGRKKIYFLTDTGRYEIKALYSVFSDFFSGLKKKMR